MPETTAAQGTWVCSGLGKKRSQ